MSAYPETVSFDLTGPLFVKQMAKLQIGNPLLFERLLDALVNFTGIPWEQFDRQASVEYFETSFDGSYIVLRFQLLDAEVRLVGQLSDGIVILGSFHKPIIHVMHDHNLGS